MCGFSPVCILSCLTFSWGLVNLRPQCWHWYGFRLFGSARSAAVVEVVVVTVLPESAPLVVGALTPLLTKTTGSLDSGGVTMTSSVGGGGGIMMGVCSPWTAACMDRLSAESNLRLQIEQVIVSPECRAMWAVLYDSESVAPVGSLR